MGELHGPYSTDRYGQKIYGTDKSGGSTTVLDVRGWGYLTGHGHGALGLSESEALHQQLEFAERVVKALNAAEAKRP